MKKRILHHVPLDGKVYSFKSIGDTGMGGGQGDSARHQR